MVESQDILKIKRWKIGVKSIPFTQIYIKWNLLCSQQSACVLIYVYLFFSILIDS